MLVDYLLKKATSQLDSGVVTHPRRSRRHPAKSLNDLDFADDIALLESSISRAQAQLTLNETLIPQNSTTWCVWPAHIGQSCTKTAEAAADLGLIISAPKTEYMTVNCNPQPALQVYGDPINHVSDLDTLVPWWHLVQVTSKGESHLLGVHSGSWDNFGRVHTYPLQRKLSCLILLVSLYYSMAVNLPGYGKQNQHLCYLMLQSHAEYKAHWLCSEHHHLFHD